MTKTVKVYYRGKKYSKERFLKKMKKTFKKNCKKVKKTKCISCKRVFKRYNNNKKQLSDSSKRRIKRSLKKCRTCRVKECTFNDYVHHSGARIN
jgi:hypothetical protein